MVNAIKKTFINDLRALYAQVKQEIIIQISYPVDFIGMVFTAVFISFWFISFGIAVSGPNAAQKFSTMTLVGLILFFYYSQALWYVARFVRRQQVQGTLESIWLTPANKFVIIFGSALGGFVIISVALAIITIGFLILVPIQFGNIGLALLILLISIIQATGFGLMYGALLIKIKQANALMNLIQFSTMIISAVFFPFSVFPDWMLWISRFYPFSWSIDVFRTGIGLMPNPELLPANFKLFGILSPFATEMLIVIILTILLVVCGFILFRRAVNNAKKAGTLSQY